MRFYYVPDAAKPQEINYSYIRYEKKWEKHILNMVLRRKMWMTL